MKIFTIIFLLMVVACATSKKKLSSGGAKVKELAHKKGHGCAVMDKVMGENKIGSLELAKNHARNLVAKAGGDAIYYEETVRNSKDIKVYATAYLCARED